MSKPPHDSQAPASASEDLVERLNAAANDVVLLRAIIESNDIGSVTAAFAALLTGDSASALNGSALRKKALNRPCRSLPAETFFEVVLFADRDTLDTMQLVCSFLLNFIRERELTHLALRAIPKVNIGRSLARYDGGDRCWLPVVEKLCDGAGKELVPKSLHHLTSCLRAAFCELVWIDLAGAPEEGEPLRVLCGMIFHDLVATATFVGTLTVSKFLCDLDVVSRGIEAFKSVKAVSAEWDMDTEDVGLLGVLFDNEDEDVELLGETFFVSAAEHGVRHIGFRPDSRKSVPANTAAALSFGFAEPTAGGYRSVRGVSCKIGADFLAQIKQKAAELDEGRHVGFNFKLDNVSSQIDSTGFEKYLNSEGRTWLMNDLANHVSVVVKQSENLVDIHVFSSS